MLVDGAPYVLEHTAIPPSLLVPLAKAKARKGRVTFDLDEYEMGYFSPLGRPVEPAS